MGKRKKGHKYNPDCYCVDCDPNGSGKRANFDVNVLPWILLAIFVGLVVGNGISG